MKTLGDRIKALREENDLTQKELAKRLNVANTTLSQYESGQRVPSDEVKMKIAEYFNVTVDYLIGHEVLPATEEYIKELRELMKDKGYDISNMSNQEIAEKLIKAFKLDEIYKSD